MNYAQKILQELLMEEVQQNFVTNAIKKRHEVSFTYNNNDGDNRGKKERITVQPVAYGETKAGNPCFRAYQINGSSESHEKGEGEIPGWRLFLLDRVVDNSWKDSGKVFKEPPGYNREGDKTMSQVLVMADFEGSATHYQRGGLKKYNDERHAKNVENNPFYDFEKQLKHKEKAPDFVTRNIQNTEKSQYGRERDWGEAMKALSHGNAESINDMSKQKDFGNDEMQQTIGPKRKGIPQQTVQTNNTPNNYATALRNGPSYKGEEILKQTNIENNEDEDEYRQYTGGSTEANA